MCEAAQARWSGDGWKKVNGYGVECTGGCAHRARGGETRAWMGGSWLVSSVKLLGFCYAGNEYISTGILIVQFQWDGWYTGSAMIHDS